MRLAKLAFIILTLIGVELAQSNCAQTVADYRMASLESEARQHPESAQAQYELGVAYLESNKDTNCPKAIKALKRATQIKPDFAEAYCKLGEAYDVFHFDQYKSDHSAEEVEAFRKAIKINPNYAEAYVGLGKTFIRSENGVTDQEALKQATELFNRAIEIKPDCKEAYRGLESVYLIQHKKKEAVQISKQIVLLDINDYRSYADLTEYCTRLPLCDEVIAAYNEIIGVKPDNGIAYSGLGRSYIERHQYNEAADALKKAVEYSPEDQYAHYYLGIAYIYLGNKEAAMEEYNTLRKLPKASFPGCTVSEYLDEGLLSRINQQ